MNINNKKTAASLLIGLASLSAFNLSANEACQFDKKINLKIAYSKGNFDINSKEADNSYSKTHNNASRIGGNLSYSCGETTLKYTHHSVIDYRSSFESKKIINTYTLQNKQYGALTLGKLTTPYKAAGKKLDPFWDTPAGTVHAAHNFGFSSLTRGFSNKSLFYVSPSFSGLTFSIGYSGVNSNGDKQGGVEYQNSHYKIGMQLIDFGDDIFVANGHGSKDAIRLYGQYQYQDWSLTSSIERLTKTLGENETYFNFSAEKPIEGFGRLALSYGQVQDVNIKFIDGSPVSGDGIGFSAGAFYKFLEKSEIYLLATQVDFDDNKDQQTLALGINLLFDF